MKLEFVGPYDAERGAELIEFVSTPQFAPALLNEANTLGTVEELFGYLVLDDAEPQTIVSASRLAGSEARVTAYVERYFRHDPAVHKFRQTEPGTSVVVRIPQGKILASDYRRQCFRTPGFAEKLSFAWRGKGYLLVISFYRRDDADPLVLMKLASLVALVMPVMVRHLAPVNRDNPLEVLERRLRRSYPALSVRETEVCARTILGWSSARVAGELHIGPGSVLTYRNRAYEKTGHSCAGDFVPNVLL